MIYDIFTFFYELDLLEIRLNILDPYVDKFVIIEANETFMGESKPLYFKENKERFSKWQNKIIHYVIDDFPNDIELLNMAKASPNVGSGEHFWVREFYQKESIKKSLIGLDDEDICYVGDLDEIWRPNLPIDFSKDQMFRPRQTSYLYYLNNRTNGVDLWTGTIVTQYKNIKNACLNHLRNRHGNQYTIIENGGWHFEAFGGIYGAKTKMFVGKHVDYYRPYLIANIEQIQSMNLDYKGRNLTIWKDDSDLPQYVYDNYEILKQKGFIK